MYLAWVCVYFTCFFKKQKAYKGCSRKCPRGGGGGGSNDFSVRYPVVKNKKICPASCGLNKKPCPAPCGLDKKLCPVPCGLKIKNVIIMGQFVCFFYICQ